MLWGFSWFGSGRGACSAAILSATLCCSAVTLAWAQPPDDAADWVMDTWQTEAGLPHNSVTAILQAGDHYLWVGTSNGLARFDGVRFATYRAVDEPGLRSNRILCLYEDSRGSLWIGTEDGGLARYWLRRRMRYPISIPFEPSYEWASSRTMNLRRLFLKRSASRGRRSRYSIIAKLVRRMWGG